MIEETSNRLIRLTLLILTCALLFQHVAYTQCTVLVWSDEFNYTGLPDPENWTFETGGGGWGNNELQYYRDGTNNAEVVDGKLVITARKESYGGRNYTSARLITLTTGHFWQYGKIEARIKLPYGKGIWPAFWMLGKNFNEVGWPACGEIDIMEKIGGGTNEKTVYGTAHWDHNGNYASYGGQVSLSSGVFADDFHVFSIEWDSQFVKWFLDGQEYHIIDITPQALSEFHNEFFIILNVAVGGNWPGSPDLTTVFPQTMEVDYVRVYSSPDYLKMKGPSEVVPGQTGLVYELPYDEYATYSWTVPDGTTISGRSDSSAIMVDWGCSEGTVACNLVTTCNSYEPDIPVKLKDNKIKGDHFFTDNQTGMVYSVTETVNATYNWSVPEGATITSGQGTYTITLDMGTAEGIVSVAITNDCGKDTLVKYLLYPGQYPYPDPMISHLLPGTIEPVRFDFGGEGVAYHDGTASNQGNGSRQDESVDTELNDGGETIGYTEPGEWIEYTIRVDTPGIYYTELRVASNQATSGPLQILVNEQDRLGSINIPNTGGWSKFTSIFPGQIELFVTDTILRYEITGGGFNIGRFKVTTLNPVSVEETTGDHIRIYPNPVVEYLMVSGTDIIQNLEIVDFSGRVVTSASVNDYSSRLDVREFSPGIYGLKIVCAGKTFFFKKFIKL